MRLLQVQHNKNQSVDSFLFFAIASMNNPTIFINHWMNWCDKNTTSTTSATRNKMMVMTQLQKLLPYSGSRWLPPFSYHSSSPSIKPLMVNWYCVYVWPKWSISCSDPTASISGKAYSLSMAILPSVSCWPYFSTSWFIFLRRWSCILIFPGWDEVYFKFWRRGSWSCRCRSCIGSSKGGWRWLPAIVFGSVIWLVGATHSICCWSEWGKRHLLDLSFDRVGWASGFIFFIDVPERHSSRFNGQI